MGFAAGGICHATEFDAAAYHCASAFPMSSSSAGGSVHLYCVEATASGTLSLLRTEFKSGMVPAVSAKNYSVGFVPSPCDDSMLSGNPFVLSLGEGALISAAVLGVWAIAACWRELAAFIQGGYSSEELR